MCISNYLCGIIFDGLFEVQIGSYASYLGGPVASVVLKCTDTSTGPGIS